MYRTSPIIFVTVVHHRRFSRYTRITTFTLQLRSWLPIVDAGISESILLEKTAKAYENALNGKENCFLFIQKCRTNHDFHKLDFPKKTGRRLPKSWLSGILWIHWFAVYRIQWSEFFVIEINNVFSAFSELI